MKRGDLIVVQQRGTAASKARPCLVVQTDAALPAQRRVTVCPLTSSLSGAALIRVPIAPGGETGLGKPSEIEIDYIESVRADRIGKTIGRADASVMAQVDSALRRWLDL